MSKTKAQIVALGNPKGFTGMKVADIIAKISDYIDKNVSNRAFVSFSFISRLLVTIYW